MDHHSSKRTLEAPLLHLPQPKIASAEGDGELFLVNAPIPPGVEKPLPAVVVPSMERRISFAEDVRVRLLVANLSNDDFDTRLAAKAALGPYFEQYGADLYPSVRHGFGNPESAFRLDELLKGREKLFHPLVLAQGMMVTDFTSDRLKVLSRRELGDTPLPVPKVFQILREIDACERSFSLREREMFCSALEKGNDQNAKYRLFFTYALTGDEGRIRDPKCFSYTSLGIVWSMMDLSWASSMPEQAKNLTEEQLLKRKQEYAFELFEKLAKDLPNRLAFPGFDDSAFETARCAARINLHLDERFRGLWTKSRGDLRDLDRFKGKKP